MDIFAVLSRNRELRQQASDGYQQLSVQQAKLRRYLVIAIYTCVHVGLVLREEYQAAELMQDVIDDIKDPLVQA